MVYIGHTVFPLAKVLKDNPVEKDFTNSPHVHIMVIKIEIYAGGNSI